MTGSGLTRGALALTHRAIEALRPTTKPFRVRDERCFGLAIRVAPSGHKTWDLAYRIRGTGRVRRLSLGGFADVTLDQARERANQLTGAARKGRDLVSEEAAARAAVATQPTIEQLVALYYRKRVAGQLRTANEIQRRLRRGLAPILSQPAIHIRRRDLRTLFDAVADDGHKREAEKRRQVVGTMFRWALSQDLVDSDPTAGLTAYSTGAMRDRVLTDTEINALWGWLQCIDQPTKIPDILRLQLLTGARCGEISGLTVEEIDIKKCLWTLPAARSKNKQARVTPLLGCARDILAYRLAEVGKGPIFTTQTGSTYTAAHVGAFLLSRKKEMPVGRFTTHDLRRTVATRLVEMGADLDGVAALLGHQLGGGQTRILARHYIRSELLERKAELLTRWGQRLQNIISKPG